MKYKDLLESEVKINSLFNENYLALFFYLFLRGTQKHSKVSHWKIKA